MSGKHFTEKKLTFPVLNVSNVVALGSCNEISLEGIGFHFPIEEEVNKKFRTRKNTTHCVEGKEKVLGKVFLVVDIDLHVWLLLARGYC